MKKTYIAPMADIFNVNNTVMLAGSVTVDINPTDGLVDPVIDSGSVLSKESMLGVENVITEELTVSELSTGVSIAN